MRLVAGRVAMLWIAVCLLPALCGAQEQLFKLNDETLNVSIVRPLPGSIARGMAAFFVDLENDAAATRLVELNYAPRTSSSGRFDIRASVEVPAGKTVRFEMLVPTFVDLYGGDLTVRSGGEEKRRGSFQAGFWQRGAGACKPVLVLGDGSAPESEVVGWRAKLGVAELTTGSISIPEMELHYIQVADLPRRFESYSGLHAMIVDTSFAVPSGALEPALRWVRLGGTLIFSGPDARKRAEQLPGVSSWLQDRFIYVNSLQARESGATELYHFGLGQLVIAESTEFLGFGEAGPVRAAILQNPGFVPSQTNIGRFPWIGATPSAAKAPLGTFIRPLPLDGIGELPYRLFIVLLIVFFFVVAPLNFRLVKKSGRAAWLLLTIPALAGCASLGFLGYGVFYQGLGLSQASESISVLDQREHRAETVELRSFFAGIAPRDGLVPEAGTLVLPVREDSWREPTSFYRIDMGSSLALKGDYLPVRSDATQVVLSDRAARGRLGIEPIGTTYRVTNGLGAPIEKLALHVPGRGLFLYVGDLGKTITGGSGESLVPALGLTPDLGGWLPSPREGRDLGWADDLPEGMYLAILSSNPFADNTGLEPDDAEGRHVVFGVLPMQVEDWK